MSATYSNSLKIKHKCRERMIMQMWLNVNMWNLVKG